MVRKRLGIPSSVANVTDFGAIPNDTSKASVNNAAFAAALASGAGRVLVPQGTFWVSAEILLPSYIHFKGSGINRTTIKMIDGIGESYNLVTNSLNDRLSRTTYNESVHVSDMTLDRNGENRVAGGPSGGTGGTCLGFSTVRHSLVERVRGRGGVWNCFDVAASYYATGGTSFYAEGPSDNVVLRDCIAVDPLLDDGFTCHFSRFVRFESCRAEISDGQYCYWNSNGFEIDEGSIDCSVVDCYAYRFSKGFQSKGHTNTPGAIRSTFDRCTAEGCGLSFTAESTDLTGKDLRYMNCTSLNPTFVGIHNTAEGERSSVAGSGQWTEARGIEIKGHVGVTMENFTLIGGTSNSVVLTDGKNYTLDGLRIKDVPVNRNAGMDATRGFIQFWGDTSENFVLRNVVCETPLTYRLIRNSINNPGKPFVVQDIYAVGNSGTEACVNEWKAGITFIERIYQTGYAADISPVVPDAAFFEGPAVGGSTLQDTWTKPKGARSISFIVQAPGGGGGSGRNGAAASVRCGGGGGGAGGLNLMTYPAADLPDTLYVTIATPGAGGAAVSANSTNGNAGTGSNNFAYVSTVAANNSPSTTVAIANPGQNGSGGTATTGTGGSSGAGMYSGGTGGSASTTGAAGANGAAGQSGAPSGGGSGGGITTGNAASAGGGSAAPYPRFNSASSGGAVNTAGAAGTEYLNLGNPSSGRGGSGGGSSTTTAGGRGGAGGRYGAGGGGGGASTNSVGNSGAGGDGGRGYVLIIVER